MIALPYLWHKHKLFIIWSLPKRGFLSCPVLTTVDIAFSMAVVLPLSVPQHLHTVVPSPFSPQFSPLPIYLSFQASHGVPWHGCCPFELLSAMIAWRPAQDGAHWPLLQRDGRVHGAQICHKDLETINDGLGEGFRLPCSSHNPKMCWQLMVVKREKFQGPTFSPKTHRQSIGRNCFNFHSVADYPLIKFLYTPLSSAHSYMESQLHLLVCQPGLGWNLWKHIDFVHKTAH